MNVSPFKPITVGEVLWRQNPSSYNAQRTGTQGANPAANADKVDISSEAGVLAELHRATTTPGYFGKTADLLTDAERAKLEKMSTYYDGKKDKQINDLAVSLAMDKIMAYASKTKVPTMDKEYLLGIMKKLTGGTQEDTLHSKLDLSLVSDLLDNSYLLA